MRRGGIELALLHQNEPRRFIISMGFVDEGTKRYHCVYFDTAFEWSREDSVLGWLHGRGVVKDNQTDIPVNLVEEADRNSSETARAFFAAPYTTYMRIETVYELVRKEQKRRLDNSQTWRTTLSGNWRIDLPIFKTGVSRAMHIAPNGTRYLRPLTTWGDRRRRPFRVRSVESPLLDS
jgi:hypothetical protein